MRSFMHPIHPSIQSICANSSIDECNGGIEIDRERDPRLRPITRLVADHIPFPHPTVTPWPAPLPVPLLLLLLLAATLLGKHCPHTSKPLPFLSPLYKYTATGVSATSTGEAVLRLDAGNFELAVQSYPTLAILFHEGGNGDREGMEVVAAWEEVRSGRMCMSFCVSWYVCMCWCVRMSVRTCVSPSVLSCLHTDPIDHRPSTILQAARLAAPRIRGQGLEMGFAAIDAGSSQGAPC